MRAAGGGCSRDGGRDLLLRCGCDVVAVAVLLARVCVDDGVRLLAEEDVEPAEVGRVAAWGLVNVVDGG